MESPNFVAGGNIYPSRIVVLDSSTDSTTGPAGSFVALAASSSDSAATATNRPFLGISQPGTDYPPINDNTHVTVGGYAAVAGEDLMIYGPGQQAMLELFTTVAAGQRVGISSAVTATADQGKGCPVGAWAISTAQQYVGIALQSGVAGEKILVLVNPGVF